MKKRKKALSRRVKRMDRPARLQSARSWLPTYTGKNIVSGYRKHFGVDWTCAFRELEMLGVQIDSAYRNELLRSVEGHIAARRLRKARTKAAYDNFLEQDENFAYIAGYTDAGFRYGITWEEWEQLDLSETDSYLGNNEYEETPELVEQDENFVYIAGYTEDGEAYGVTWEEWEELNETIRAEETPRSVEKIRVRGTTG